VAIYCSCNRMEFSKKKRDGEKEMTSVKQKKATATGLFKQWYKITHSNTASLQELHYTYM